MSRWRTTMIMCAAIACTSGSAPWLEDDEQAAGVIIGGTDFDGDGFCPGLDFDDDDPSIYPGAPEIDGDGVDSNCDGLDGTAQPPRSVPAKHAYIDFDGDGQCTRPDCDDTDPTIFKGAPDPAADGLDSDCDGVDGVEAGCHLRESVQDGQVLWVWHNCDDVCGADDLGSADCDDTCDVEDHAGS